MSFLQKFMAAMLLNKKASLANFLSWMRKTWHGTSHRIC